MEDGSDDTLSDDWIRKTLKKSGKNEKINVILDWISNPKLDLLWIKDLLMLYYTLKFSTMNPFERLYMGIHDMDPIQFEYQIS